MILGKGVAVGLVGPLIGDWIIAVFGSRTSGNALGAFGARRTNGLPRRFRSGATRSSAAETGLFRDWFLVAVATAAVRHGVLKHEIESLLLDNRQRHGDITLSIEQICIIVRDISASRDRVPRCECSNTLLRTETDTYLVLIKLSLTISTTVSYDAVGIDEREREIDLWLVERLTRY